MYYQVPGTAVLLILFIFYEISIIDFCSLCWCFFFVCLCLLLISPCRLRFVLYIYLVRITMYQVCSYSVQLWVLIHGKISFLPISVLFFCRDSWCPFLSTSFSPDKRTAVDCTACFLRSFLRVVLRIYLSVTFSGFPPRQQNSEILLQGQGLQTYLVYY